MSLGRIARVKRPRENLRSGRLDRPADREVAMTTERAGPMSCAAFLTLVQWSGSSDIASLGVYVGTAMCDSPVALSCFTGRAPFWRLVPLHSGQPSRQSGAHHLCFVFVFLISPSGMVSSSLAIFEISHELAELSGGRIRH